MKSKDSTGNYPDWNDIAADWVVKNCFGGKESE